MPRRHSDGVLLAVPNVSEGRDRAKIAELTKSVGNARLLDVHTDADHNRTVLTVAGPVEQLIDSAVALVATAAHLIDLRTHAGVHPRAGAVDVLPFVAHDAPHEDAVRAARKSTARIRTELDIPAYAYDDASPDHTPLPELRRAIAQGRHPVHPTAGAVCVGARRPLVAFNVDLEGTIEGARAVAAAVRESSGGLRGVRALAFELTSRGLVQVSMNLVAPDVTGPRAAWDAVATLAPRHGLRVIAGELVGLVPRRYLAEFDSMPLRREARSVESALESLDERA